MEFVGGTFEVVVPVLEELAHVEAVFDSRLLHLSVLAGEHYAESLSLVVHDVLGKGSRHFFGEVPLGDIEEGVNFVLLAVEG